MTAASATFLDDECRTWLREVACDIDTGTEPAEAVLPRLAQAGLPAAGVPVAHGGAGGNVVDGVMAIAETAEESLASAFMLWGHRSYIEYLLQSSNGELRDRLLPDLLSGETAGATALSNAMKFLAGIEALQISAAIDADGLVLDGKMPWVTNLRPTGFHVAAASDRTDDGTPIIVSLAHDDDGLERSPDLSLMGMRSTDTAAVKLSAVRVGRDRIISDNAPAWLPRVRPAFLGLQCGMSIGLARRALREAEAAAGTLRGVLVEPIAEARSRLENAQRRLFSGLQSREFEAAAPPLFELRIELADIAAEAVALELQASGGKAYLSGPGQDFARRWREVAFIPVITPSLVQLKTALRQHRKNAA